MDESFELPHQKSLFKRLLPFLVPFTIVLSIGMTFALRAKLAGDAVHYGPVIDTPYDDISIGTPDVRVKGTAHYPIVINQRVPGNLFFEEKTYYLFGFFAPRHRRTSHPHHRAHGTSSELGQLRT